MKKKLFRLISILLIVMLSCGLRVTASFAMEENTVPEAGISESGSLADDGNELQSNDGQSEQESTESSEQAGGNGNFEGEGDISLNEPDNNVFRLIDNRWYYIKDDKIASYLTSIEYGAVNGEAGWWFIRNGLVTFETTVDRNSNGWWYVKNGKVDFDYTGFGSNAFGDWYCENGKVNFNKNSIIYGSVNGVSAWWLVEGSQVVYKTKLASNASGWYYVENGKVNFDYTGFATNENGTWYVEGGNITFAKNDVMYATVNGQSAWWYIEESKVSNKTTVAANSNGLWFIKDGKVDFNYTGFGQNDEGWWYAEKGSVSKQKNDIVQGTVNGINGWWLIENSKVEFKTIVAENKYGWWYVDNGKVDFNYNGFGENEYGWWYAQAGQIDFKKTGIVEGTINGRKGRYLVKQNKLDEQTTIVKEGNEWLYVEKGYVNTDFSGLAENGNGGWYVEKGKVNFDREDVVYGTIGGEKAWWYVKDSKVTYTTTVAHNSSGWWYVKNGRVDFSYAGIGDNSNGSWYIEGGQVKFAFSGVFADGSKIYFINGGKVDDTKTGFVDFDGAKYYISKGVINKNFTGWVIVQQQTYYVKDGVLCDDLSSLVFSNNTFISPVADGNIFIANSISNSQAGISNAKYQLECVHACYCDVHMWTNPNSGHQGIDIRCWEPGKNLLALTDGKVVYVNHQTYENNGSYGAHPGEAIAVDFGNGLIYEYHEMQANSCKWKVGDTVHAGDVVGKIGVTGVTTGYHIHLSVIYWTGAENVSDEELASKMPQYKGPSSVGSNGFAQVNPLYFFGQGLTSQADYWYAKYPYEWYGSKLSIPGDPRNYQTLAYRMTR